MISKEGRGRGKKGLKALFYCPVMMLENHHGRIMHLTSMYANKAHVPLVNSLSFVCSVWVGTGGTFLQEVVSIDNLMKNKLANYSVVKGNLQGIQRREV